MKEISGEGCIPAQLWRRAEPLRGPRVGGPDAETTLPRHSRHGEFLKNTINIDKFTGLFDKFLKINRRIIPCKTLKYNGYDEYMSAGRSNKGPMNFFSLRICPQFR